MPVHYTQHGFVGLVEGAETVPLAELVAFLDDLAANDSARVVVLVLPSPAGSGEGSGARAYAPAASDAGLYELSLTPLPLVAALAGSVGGVAIGLAGACDIRICDAGATLHAGWRMRTRASAGLHPLPAGPTFDAETALTEGLVSEVTAPGEALPRALQLAETIASRGPIATRLAKEALWRGRAMPLAQALRFETDLTLLLQTTKDRAEGVSAFIEKRKPTFTGN